MVLKINILQECVPVAKLIPCAQLCSNNCLELATYTLQSTTWNPGSLSAWFNISLYMPDTWDQTPAKKFCISEKISIPLEQVNNIPPNLCIVLKYKRMKVLKFVILLCCILFFVEG